MRYALTYTRYVVDEVRLVHRTFIEDHVGVAYHDRLDQAQVYTELYAAGFRRDGFQVHASPDKRLVIAVSPPHLAVQAVTVVEIVDLEG